MKAREYETATATMAQQNVMYAAVDILSCLENYNARAYKLIPPHVLAYIPALSGLKIVRDDKMMAVVHRIGRWVLNTQGSELRKAQTLVAVQAAMAQVAHTWVKLDSAEMSDHCENYQKVPCILVERMEQDKEDAWPLFQIILAIPAGSCDGIVIGKRGRFVEPIRQRFRDVKIKVFDGNITIKSCSEAVCRTVQRIFSHEIHKQLHYVDSSDNELGDRNSRNSRTTNGTFQDESEFLDQESLYRERKMRHKKLYEGLHGHERLYVQDEYRPRARGKKQFAFAS